jgi:hypothetical protein
MPHHRVSTHRARVLGGSVSARIVPSEGHSVEEIRRLLEPVATEIRLVSPGVLNYEGSREGLRSVEGIAAVHVLPYQRFPRTYF